MMYFSRQEEGYSTVFDSVVSISFSMSCSLVSDCEDNYRLCLWRVYMMFISWAPVTFDFSSPSFVCTASLDLSSSKTSQSDRIVLIALDKLREYYLNSQRTLSNLCSAICWSLWIYFIIGLFKYSIAMSWYCSDLQGLATYPFITLEQSM